MGAERASGEARDEHPDYPEKCGCCLTFLFFLSSSSVSFSVSLGGTVVGSCANTREKNAGSRRISDRAVNLAGALCRPV